MYVRFAVLRAGIENFHHGTDNRFYILFYAHMHLDVHTYFACREWCFCWTTWCGILWQNSQHHLFHFGADRGWCFWGECGYLPILTGVSCVVVAAHQYRAAHHFICEWWAFSRLSCALGWSLTVVEFCDTGSTPWPSHNALQQQSPDWVCIMYNQQAKYITSHSWHNQG